MFKKILCVVLGGIFPMIVMAAPVQAGTGGCASNGHTFVRVQLLDPADREYAVAVGAGITFRPETHHYREFVAPTGGWERIAAGTFSPWIDLRKHIQSEDMRIALRFESRPPLERFKARIQVSRTPGEEGLVRDLTEENTGHILGMTIPLELTDASQVMTMRQAIEDRAGRYGNLAFPGRRPRRMGVYTGCEYWGAFYEDLALRDGELGVLSRLGFNGLGLGANPGWMDGAAPFGLDRAYFIRTRTKFRKTYLPLDEATAAREQRCRSLIDFLAGSGDIDKIAVIKLSDEPKSFGPADLDGQEDAVRRFHVYLRSLGLTPATFGRARWEDVDFAPLNAGRASPERDATQSRHSRISELTSREARESRDPHLRRLYYWAMRFASRLTSDYLREFRRVHERHFPDALTMVNQNNPAVVGMLPLIPDVFDIGRRDILPLQWAEDWTCVHYGIGPQACTYIVNLLRSGAKYGDQPIGMYNMVNHVAGNTAATLRLKTYSILGGCPRHLYFYNYGPTFGKPVIDNWNHLPDLVEEVGRLIHEIGVVEDFIVDGRPEPSQVAVVWSKSDEIWHDPWNDPKGQYHVNQHLTYLALLHGGHQPAFLDETDLVTGWLDGCKALYLVRPVLERRAAVEIERWVRAGGVLWMNAGAGRFDEYHEPLDTFDPMLGATRGAVREQDIPDERAARTLPALDVLRLNGARGLSEAGLDLYGAVDDIRLADGNDAEVLGTLTNGLPGALVKPYGRGRVVYVAGLAGLSYFRAADRNVVTLLSSPEAPRRLIALGAELAGANRPVRVSEPMVEARLIRSPHGLLIPLANYSMKPIGALTVRIADTDPDPWRIETLSGASVVVTREGPDTVLSLPVEVTEMLLLQPRAPQ